MLKEEKKEQVRTSCEPKLGSHILKQLDELHQEKNIIDCHEMYYKFPKIKSNIFCSTLDCLACGLTYFYRLCKSDSQVIEQRENSSSGSLAILKFQPRLTAQQKKEKKIKKAQKILEAELVNRNRVCCQKEGKKKKEKKIIKGKREKMVFNTMILRKMLVSQAGFCKFLPAFLLLITLYCLVPFIFYGLIVFLFFNRKDRYYLYKLFGSFLGKSPDSQPEGLALKTLTHIFLVCYPVGFSFGFYVCLSYFILYHQQPHPVPYLIDVAILSLLNLFVGMFLFLTAIISGLVGNHHLHQSHKNMLLTELERATIDETQFHIEFLCQQFGDPIINYQLQCEFNQSMSVNRQLLELKEKNWISGFAVLQYYLLTYDTSAFACGRFFQTMKEKVLKFEVHECLHRILKKKAKRKEEKKNKINEKSKKVNQPLRSRVKVLCNKMKLKYQKRKEKQAILRDKERMIEPVVVSQILVRHLQKDTFKTEFNRLEPSGDRSPVRINFEDSQNQKYFNEGNVDQELAQIRLSWLIEEYRSRIECVYSEQMSCNLYRLLKLVFQVALFLATVFRVLLPLAYYISDDAPEYRIQNPPLDHFVVAAIVVNFTIYELMKLKIIGQDVNRTIEKNALIRMNNLIAWGSDKNYFIPKELPTMNLYCKVTWSSWYNARRVVGMHYSMEKRVIDGGYTLIGLYGLVIIGLLVFDHYGTFWPKQLFFDNNLLVYLFVIDVIVITCNISGNLINGCDINQLHLNCKNIVTEFLLSLKFMSTHWDLLDKGDSQEPQRVVDEEIGNEQENKPLRVPEQNSSTCMNRFRLAYLLMEREQRIRGQENVEDDVVKEYLDDLINIVENISNLVENDANLRQDKFLGCIPVTYEYMTGLAMTILPLIGALLQQYIRKEPLEVNPFDS